MFYGKPAYRTKHVGIDGISANLPCAFVFSPDVLSAKIDAIYPFDTGAFESGLLAKYFHKRSQLSGFRFDGDVNFAKQLVDFFYQSNSEYYSGRSAKNVNIPALSFEAEGIHELARAPADPNAKSNYSPDERASAIEIQLSEDVPIEKGLLAILVPNVALDNDTVKAQIEELSPPTILTYDSMNNFGSEALAAVIYEKIRCFMIEKDFLE